MKYINKLFFISLFLCDLGINVFGQGIYFWQILSVFIFFTMVINNELVLSKLFIFIFILLLIFYCINIYNFHEYNYFNSNYISSTLISYINFFIFITSVFVVKNKIKFFSVKIFWVVFFLSILILIIELASSKLGFLKAFLDIYHLNPKAISKSVPSGLGREHSYGAFAVACILFFSLHFYNSKKINFFSFVFVFCICFIQILILESKTFLIWSLFSFIAVSTALKINKKVKFILILISCIMGLVVYDYFVLRFSEIILLETGSSYSRFYLTYIAYTAYLDNFVFGTGIGSYKFLFKDYVDQMNIPLKFDIYGFYFSGGSPDSTNFIFGMLSELGLIGLFIIFYLTKQIFIIYKLGSKLALSLILLLIFSSFGFYYWSVSFYPLLIGFIPAEKRIFLNAKHRS